MLQTTYTDHTLWKFCKVFYLVLLGQYDGYLSINPGTLLDSDVSFLIIISVSIIMVILMLNMLIALISESHGDVMKLERQAERYEKLHLMINSYQSSKTRLVKRFFRGCSKSKKNEMLDDKFIKYCGFVRYEENISVEMAEKLEERRRQEAISHKLERIKEKMEKI